MHELGIAEQMFKTALDYAARDHAARIASFHIEMNETADESEDALRFHLENLTRGTIGQDAHIVIRRVPVRKRCLDCGTEFDWRDTKGACPKCTSTRIRTLPQDEFRLVSIDVE